MIGVKKVWEERNMLNTIWALMILIGVAVGILTGNMEAVGNGALESAGSAVTLCITMMGILSMWTGLMQVARASGLLEKMAGWLSPVIGFLFPKLKKDSKAAEYIATNMVANVLGLGWAATPAGIKAMEELALLEEERGTPGYSGPVPVEESVPREASDEMCTLLVINMSSLQLIPINMIAYRSQYGSVSPAAIVAPVIVATVISTIAAVVFCKLKQKY
jgi:spore maturation protein A